MSDGAQTAIVSYGMEPELIGRWTHLAVVVDRATAKVRAYVDGATKQEVMLPASFGSIATSAPLELGRSQTYVFRGVLDEVRIYNKPRTAGWFAAEHRFLTAPSESIVVGFEEPL